MGEAPSLGDVAREELGRAYRAGMGQGDLGDLVGVTQAAVSRWEKAERDPGIGGLVLIAAAPGVPVSSLLPEEEAPGA